MKNILPILALIFASTASHATVVCTVINSPIALEFTRGTPYTTPGGIFRSAETVTPVIIMQINALSGARTVYENGCATNPKVTGEDNTAVYISFCPSQNFAIYKSAPYCQNGVCPAKLDFGTVTNDSSVHHVVDATCKGTF